MEKMAVLGLRGCIEHALYDAFTGKRLKYEKKDNLLVTVGRAWVLGQLESVNIVTSQTISYLALGSVSNAPATSDSSLGGEVTRTAIATFATSGLTNNPPSWQAQVSFATNQANTTLAEVGLFNSTSGGTMISHATFTSFVKATSNTYAISYTISG